MGTAAQATPARPPDPTGRPAVVQVWAPWCNSCRAMEPILEGLAREYGSVVDVRRVQAEVDLDTTRALGVRGVPTLVVLDPDGGERVRHTGAMGERDLRYLFDQAVATGDTGVAAGRPAASGRGPVLHAARVDRSLRVAAGGALVVAGLALGPTPVLLAVGVVVAATALRPTGLRSR